MYQQRRITCSSLKWCGMNFVGDDVFMLGTSAVSLPCSNNNALKSFLSYKGLRINHIGTWCSMTSSWALWFLVIKSWALLGFVFSVVLAGGYFLREVKPKFIPCYKCKSTVTEQKNLAKKAQCNLFSCFCQDSNISEMPSKMYLGNSIY